MRMRTWVYSFFSSMLLLVLSVVIVQAQSPFPEEIRDTAVGSMVLDQLSGVLTTDQTGPHFRAGDSVTLTDTFNGDVYAAGGTVQMTGTVNGDLIAAGGTVNIAGTVTDDIRVAGGTVIIDGNVGKNVTVAGGTVNFTRDSQVGGSVIVTGGTVTIDGQVAGNVYGGSGTAALTGSFGNNVVFDSGTLSIPQTASIAGNLRATSERQPDVSSQARIAGSREVRMREQGQTREVDSGTLKGIAATGILTQFIVGSLMAILVGSALMYMMPRFWTSTVEPVETAVLSSLGWGLTYVLLLPLVVILLFVTVLGIPLGIILICLAIISMIIAGWIAAFALGRYIYRKSEAEWLNNRYVQLAVGVITLNFIGVIPVIGWVVKAIAFFIGMGAILMWLKMWVNPESQVAAPAVVPARKTTVRRKRSK